MLPELEPILLRDGQEIPPLNDESLYLAVDIRSGDDFHYAVVEVPTDRLDRFVEIPRRRGKGNATSYGVVPLQLLGGAQTAEAKAGCRRIGDARLKQYQELMNNPAQWDKIASHAMYRFSQTWPASIDISRGTLRLRCHILR